MINVTKTYIPSLEKYQNYVKEIFDSGWLTNEGKLKQLLQENLTQYLGVKYIVMVSNGTLALQVAYKLLGLKGDVLTTPFSFVATTSSLVWEGLNPIFVDIDENTLNIDPSKIEKMITPNTTAIVATHVYGNACDIEKINQIAKKYNLKVIYDAAHAFGVEYKGESILNFGDISILSFHSTKVFHTIEGGALIIRNEELYEKAKKMINFGIIGPSEIVELGINTKMNEFQAAMGLCILDDLNEIMENRSLRYNYYLNRLILLKNIRIPKQNQNSKNNSSYFPVVFENEITLLRVIEMLKYININPRRYFHPSLEMLPYLSERQFAPISNSISSRVLCLPLYDSLDFNIQDEIIDTIKNAIEKNDN